MQVCNDVLSIFIQQSLLDPIHNKFTVKSSVKSLPEGRSWWLTCFPAGNSELMKDVFVLILRVAGGPASVDTRILIKRTDVSYTQNNLYIKNDKQQATLLFLTHDVLKMLNLPENIELEVHGTFKWNKDVKNNGLWLLQSTIPGQIVLTKADVEAAKMGDCRSTPRFDVPDIPGLQWWLDYYPNGNRGQTSGTLIIFICVSMGPVYVNLEYSIISPTETAGNSVVETNTFIAFIRVSTVPVTVNAVYSFAGTNIRKQIQFEFTSVDARGANFVITHSKMTAVNAFVNGNAKFQCTVSFDSSQDQSAQVPEAVQPELPSTIPLLEKLSSPTTVTESTVSAETASDITPASATLIQSNIEEAFVSENVDALPESLINEIPKRVSNMLRFHMTREYLVYPNRMITTVKRYLENGIQWFVTCLPDKKDDEGWRLSVYLNASTKVNGNVGYEVEGTNFRGMRDITNLSTALIAHFNDYNFDILTVKNVIVNIAVNLSVSTESTTPTTLSGSAESDSSEWTSTDDDEEDLESGMTDKELLLHRLKLQEDETNKVLELLKRVKPVLIADGEDFL